MKKWNSLLAVMIVSVLIIPVFVMGAVFTSACCGVYTTLITATFDATCVPSDASLYLKWNVDSTWYDSTTGYDINVWYPGSDPAGDPDWSKTVVAGTLSYEKKDFEVTYTPIPLSIAGEYTWEAVVYVAVGASRMATDSMAGTITLEACSEADIKPGSCPNSFNTKQKGVLPVAITGPEGFDASLVTNVQIQISAGPDIWLNPVKWEIKDTAKPDGIEGEWYVCESCLAYEPTCEDRDGDTIAEYCYIDEIPDFIAYFDSTEVANILNNLSADRTVCGEIYIRWNYDGVPQSDIDVLRISNVPQD